MTILGFTTCIMGTWESGLPYVFSFVFGIKESGQRRTNIHPDSSLPRISMEDRLPWSMASFWPSSDLWRHVPLLLRWPQCKFLYSQPYSCRRAALLKKNVERYPISGGQYYWASLLAPPGKVKFLSFLTGKSACLTYLATGS